MSEHKRWRECRNIPGQWEWVTSCKNCEIKIVYLSDADTPGGDIRKCAFCKRKEDDARKNNLNQWTFGRKKARP